MPAAANESAPRTLLFVYGTLKRGGTNHRWLGGQIYVGPARTTPGVTLYSVGEYPGLVRDAEDREGVTGELWEVDAACLARLDAFEGVPEGLYAREPFHLAEFPAGAASRAELYRYLRKVSPSARIGHTWTV